MPPISNEAWESHKAEIEKLRLRDCLKLCEIQTTMSEQHNFHATKNQYERIFKEWGLRKKINNEEWKFVGRRIEKRKQEGKESDVYLNGQLIPSKKVKKELTRRLPPSMKEKFEIFASAIKGRFVTPPTLDARTPPGIFVRTPERLETPECIYAHGPVDGSISACSSRFDQPSGQLTPMSSQIMGQPPRRPEILAPFPMSPSLGHNILGFLNRQDRTENPVLPVSSKPSSTSPFRVNSCNVMRPEYQELLQKNWAVPSTSPTQFTLASPRATASTCKQMETAESFRMVVTLDDSSLTHLNRMTNSPCIDSYISTEVPPPVLMSVNPTYGRSPDFTRRTSSSMVAIQSFFSAHGLPTSSEFNCDTDGTILFTNQQPQSLLESPHSGTVLFTNQQQQHQLESMRSGTQTNQADNDEVPLFMVEAGQTLGQIASSGTITQAENEASLLDAFYKIGGVLSELGLYAKSVEWYQWALSGYEKAFGRDDPITLTTVHSMAVVFDRQGEYEKALKWYWRALAGREEILGKDHPLTLDTVNNIAVVFSIQGKYDEALKWHQRALTGREQVLGKDHLSTLGTVNNIAVVFDTQGKYDKALERYVRALDGREKALGKDHTSTLRTVNNIAVVFDSQGQYDKALKFYGRALAGMEKALGKDHPWTVRTVNNIAVVFDRQGKYDRAMEWYERALTGKEKTLGRDHPVTLRTVHNMAVVFDNKGKYDKALQWYQRALTGREKALGKDHSSTLHTARAIQRLQKRLIFTGYNK